jgi:hypothetical protein
MLRAILNLVSEGMSYRECGRRLNIHHRSILRYAERSRNGDLQTFVKWDDKEDQFVNHLQSAIAMNIAHMESEARQSGTIGFAEQIVFQGQEQWKMDPRLIGLTDDECMAKYGTKDRYLRDKNGAAIPLTVTRKPSDALVLRMLGAHLKKYGEHSTQDVNVNLSGFLRLPREGDKAKQIEQQKTIEVFSAEPKPQIADGEITPMIAIGRPAESPEELEKWAEQSATVAPMTFEHADGTTEVVDNKPQEVPVTGTTEILPTDRPDVVALKKQFAAHMERVKAGTANTQASAPVKTFSDDGPPEKVGKSNVDAAPKVAAQSTGPVLSAENFKDHPRYIEALTKRANGLPENAIDKQLLDNNNWHVLKPYSSTRDNIGAGTPPPGGRNVDIGQPALGRRSIV